MYVNVNGVRLFIDISGSGSVPSGTSMVERPTLFVLHGGPGADRSYFKRLAEASPVTTSSPRGIE